MSFWFRSKSFREELIDIQKVKRQHMEAIKETLWPLNHQKNLELDFVLPVPKMNWLCYMRFCLCVSDKEWKNRCNRKE